MVLRRPEALGLPAAGPDLATGGTFMRVGNGRGPGQPSAINLAEDPPIGQSDYCAGLTSAFLAPAL